MKIADRKQVRQFNKCMKIVRASVAKHGLGALAAMPIILKYKRDPQLFARRVAKINAA